MSKLRSFFQNLSFKENSTPLALLFVCFLGFGLLIRNLGFYMDDWPYVFYAYNKGIGSLSEMLIYDSRPSAGWLYISAFWLLGFKPLYWHIAMLLLRWLTVILLWLTIRAIWPARTREATYFALLFSIYPFFMLQPFAVGSSHHWVGFIFFSLSLLMMTRAISTGKQTVALTVGAVLFEAGHLFTSEYFAGLELIRPVILWILISRKEKNNFKLTRDVIINWLPYFFTLVTFASWRVFIYEPPADIVRNSPVILNQLFSEPLKALGFLFNASITDAISVLTIGWQQATDVELFNFNSLFGSYRLFLMVISFFIINLYLNKLTFKISPTDETDDDWKKKSPLLAITGLFLAGLPVWLIGRSIVESKNLISASRFGLPTMLGASFVLLLLITGLISDRKKTVLVLSILTALAINFHLNHTKGFEYSWEKQTRLYQELLWRAPELKPGTAIVTDEEILGYMGQYATSFGIITAYQPGDITTPPYWFFPVYYTYPDIDGFVSGIPIEDIKLSMQFSGQSTDSLVISFNPELDRCLWVLRPEDGNLRLVNDDMKKLSAVSNTDLIGNNSGEVRTLPEEIYGALPTKGWCYYFEKADLARQFGQWNEVVDLYEQAKANGEQAGNGFEYIPFIEGYAHLEDWESVKSLTKTANRISKGLEPSLCDALDRLLINAPASSKRDQTILDLSEDLDCQEFEKESILKLF